MSTDQQIKGDSLRRQLDLSRQWAEQNGLVLDETLRDIGVSAYKGKNRREGALGKFLAMVEMGRVKPGSYLLVESLDRLSRDQVLEALSLFLEILRSGIIIVTLADDQTYSQETVGNDWSKLIISLTIMARAHEESLRKSQRVAQSYEARRTRAATEGYTISSMTPGWIDAQRMGRGKIEFTLNQHAATVRRIFEMAAEGASQFAITRTLNSEGVPSITGGDTAWTQAYVGVILRSRAAVGEYQAYRRVGNRQKEPAGDPIADYFPAVISNDVWLRARDLKRRTVHERSGRKGEGFGNIFTGLCRCTACGGRMMFQASARKEKAKYAYFNCSNRRRGVGCPAPMHNFRYHEFESGVLDNVREFMLSDIMRIKRAQTPLDAIEEDIASLRVKLEDIGRRETSLMNQLEAAGDLAPMILARLRERKDERAETENRLQLSERQKAEAELAINNSVDEGEIERMRQQWETTDSMEERYNLRAKVHAALRTFIDFISFDPKDKTATVIVLGGVRAYRFKNGDLINKYDLSQQIGASADGMIDANVFVTNGRDREVDPQRVAALNKLRSHL